MQELCFHCSLIIYIASSLVCIKYKGFWLYFPLGFYSLHWRIIVWCDDADRMWHVVWDKTQMDGAGFISFLHCFRFLQALHTTHICRHFLFYQRTGRSLSVFTKCFNTYVLCSVATVTNQEMFPLSSTTSSVFCIPFDDGTICDRQLYKVWFDIWTKIRVKVSYKRRVKTYRE